MRVRVFIRRLWCTRPRQCGYPQHILNAPPHMYSQTTSSGTRPPLTTTTPRVTRSTSPASLGHAHHEASESHRRRPHCSLPSSPPPRMWPRVVLRQGSPASAHFTVHGAVGKRRAPAAGSTAARVCAATVRTPDRVQVRRARSSAPRITRLANGSWPRGSLRGPRGQCSCGGVLVHTSRTRASRSARHRRVHKNSSWDWASCEYCGYSRVHS